jgi:dipeptidyl aminopeptidase/acylaminoacyl peptidase
VVSVIPAGGLWAPRSFLASLLIGLVALTVPSRALAACGDLLPQARESAQHRRTITADDLLKLRDIGQPDGAMHGQPSPLAVSPDGSQAAFVLNRADPDGNRYCRALVVVNIAGASEPRIVDRGGELIINSTVARGFVVQTGFPALVTPVWSTDGNWIAYLRREHGTTQIRRVRADGTRAATVTRSPVDILAVAWSSDGRRLAYIAKPGVELENQQIVQEALSGWPYDERFAPHIADRPLISGAIAREAFVIDPETGQVVPADEADHALLPLEDTSGSPIPPSAISQTGQKAWTERRTSNPLSSLKLLATTAAEQTVTCRSEACDGGFTGLWWENGGKTLLILRREGWNHGEMALYRWSPGKDEPRPIFHTEDVLLGCVMARGQLLCTRENASTPRRIVLIDPKDGQSRLVFDPNPEFASINLGSVTRLQWRNNIGLEAWGDLVLPPDYRPGGKLPMIVVQYHSDGFLRGGTGDEYPIYLFAARGFAVLSIERADFFAAARPDLKTYADIAAASMNDWAERRSLLSSLVTGVNMAIERGIANPAHIGITGLSDGASTVRFALINTPLFAAAAISSCCMEQRSDMTYAGIAFADERRSMGFPPATQEDPDYWRPYSMALNAKDMDRPLLMQLADEEYLLALETFTALREHHQPVEMYVYPGEHHIKWQPAHRRAIYQRNLDWFDFWLRSRRDDDPQKAAQYARWEAMRARMERAADFSKM